MAFDFLYEDGWGGGSRGHQRFTIFAEFKNAVKYEEFSAEWMSKRNIGVASCTSGQWVEYLDTVSDCKISFDSQQDRVKTLDLVRSDHRVKTARIYIR